MDDHAEQRRSKHTHEAIEFLEKLRPGGPWIITAIVPDGDTETITAKDAGAVADFIRANDGHKNLYYSVNPTRRAMTKKAAKKDIAAIEFLLGDFDPNEGESSEAAKVRYLAALETHQPECTAIIDSGNGIQGLWRLDERIELKPPTVDGKKLVFPGVVAEVEARVKALMETMGAVAGTQNIDRILRLPGTTNLPNAKKLKDGRVACPTKLIKFNGATCKLDDFPAAKEEGASSGDGSSTADDQPLDWTKVEAHAGWLKTVADLPMDFNAKGRIIVGHSGTLGDLNADLQRAGVIEKKYGSWSDVSMALTAIFKADGRFTREQIAAALLCNIECNQHVVKHKDTEKRKRAVERLLARSHEPTVAKVARALNWRECKPNGAPVPSVYNAILAINAIGLECSCDTFHNVFLIGFKGDDFRHIVGEVDDNVILRLRYIMSNRFGIDFTERHTRDAILTLALEHCFHPVCDMLDLAEQNWDKVERLDRMAVDYFNCEDTLLNRAQVRKTMIALVHRVRHPGCKFDNIPVLEGDEGWNKSTAWEVLASEENFSDQSILGKKEQEIQETMGGGVWIHESADLAGMRKAQVEDVKSFASRKVDRGRPAYGHFPIRQKRNGINVGTTNTEKYLQSQTGNRRFWPLKVLASIDIEKLKKDRLQLLGEAAKYESSGESVVLPEELWAAATAEQEKRRINDPWEDILCDLPETIDGSDFAPIKVVHVKDGKEMVSTSVLLTFVLGIPRGRQVSYDTMRLSTVMKRLGWERSGNKLPIKDDRGAFQSRGYFRWVYGPYQPGKEPRYGWDQGNG